MKENCLFLCFILMLSGLLQGCAVDFAPNAIPDSLAEESVSEGSRIDENRAPAEAEYQESELDRALQRLVDDLELAVLGLSNTNNLKDGGPGGVHLVQPGEYLDLIIEKTLPESPIREDLLRKAFVRLNPNAFGGNGNPNYLFARQKLKIPSVEDLREIIFKSDTMENLKQRSREPNKGWISYP